MSKKEKLAYLAGLLDGEGSVSIRRVYNRAKSPSGDKIYYVAEMRIYNTDKRMIDWIQANFGGAVYQQKAQSLTRRTLYRWDCPTVTENLSIMKQLRPYTITKSALIDCAIPILELQSHGMGIRRTLSEKIAGAGEAAMQKINEIKLSVSHRGMRPKVAKVVS